MRRLSLGLLLIGACVSVPVGRIPRTIQRIGGIYQAWTPEHSRQRDALLACVHLQDGAPPPSLWISLAGLVRDDTVLAAYYDGDAHAVVFSPYVHVADYWPVFRHEILHASERTPGHGTRFRRAARCQFWANP